LARPRPPESTTPGDRLSRLAAARAPRTRDLSIAGDIRGLADSVRRAESGLGAATAAWTKAVPAHLASACAIEGLSRGVLRVRVTDSSVRFELDRFLRAGGEARVITASSAPIRSVRLSC
jgi:hypothetical protein